MSSQKLQLIKQLQQKKNQLIDLQNKCELQNKKIKLFRKQNQDLTALIYQKQQSDTNTLLHSKQLQANNSKLQKNINRLYQQLQIVKKNKIQPLSHNQQKISQSHNASQKVTKKKSFSQVIAIRDITISQQTQQLDLPNSQLVDEDILQLEGFTKLKTLILNQNLLANMAVTMICTSLVNMQKLNLANNKFTAQSLQNIKNLNQLKLLDIRNNNLNDQALKHISQVTSLCQLSCSKNSLTDQGASYLSKLLSLNYLDITNNQLTSQSAKYLTKLQKLSHLYLMSNKLSKDSIIQIIKVMKNLLFLDVRFNVWSIEDKEQIKKTKHLKIQVFC